MSSGGTEDDLQPDIEAGRGAPPINEQTQSRSGSEPVVEAATGESLPPEAPVVRFAGIDDDPEDLEAGATGEGQVGGSSGAASSLPDNTSADLSNQAFTLTEDVVSNKRRYMNIDVFFAETRRASKCLVWKQVPKYDEVISSLVAESNGGLKRPNMVLLAKKRLPRYVSKQTGWKDHISDMGGFMMKEWDEDSNTAHQKYEAAVGVCFAGIAAACSQSHCWLITYRRSTAKIIEAGLQELEKLDPGLADRVVIVCLTSLDQEPFLSRQALLDEAEDNSKTVRIESCHDSARGRAVDWSTQLSPFSTHIVVLPTENDIDWFTDHLQICFPSVHLHTTGSKSELSAYNPGGVFSKVINKAKRGTLVINFANMHFNPTYLSALLLCSGKKQLPVDELKRLWLLTKNELAKRDCPLRDQLKGKPHVFRSCMHRVSSFEKFLEHLDKPVRPDGRPDEDADTAYYLMRALKGRFENAKRLGLTEVSSTEDMSAAADIDDDPAFASATSDAYGSSEIATNLPEPLPWQDFVTFDMTEINFRVVVDTLMHHVSACKVPLDLLGGSTESAEKLLAKGWSFYDELRSVAYASKIKGYVLQLFISICTLSITFLAVIQLDRSLKYATIGKYVEELVNSSPSTLKALIVTVPVMTAFLLSIQSQFNFMLRWAVCNQSAVQVRHIIYSFQTRSGDFSHDTSKPLESAVRNNNDRIKLASSIAAIEIELRQGILSEYSWSWDGSLSDKLHDISGDDPPQDESRAGGYFKMDTPDERTRLVEVHPLRFRTMHYLSGDQFMDAALNPMLEEYQKSAGGISVGLNILRASVMLTTAAATLIGAFKYYAWVPVMVAFSAMFQRGIDFQGLPSRLTNINKAIASLREKKLWWSSLTQSDRMIAQNLGILVQAVELSSDAETSAILQAVKSFKQDPIRPNVQVAMKPNGQMVI